MIRAILVALAAELSFLIGLIVGSIASGFAALVITAIRGWGRLSFVRALLQGTMAGLIAGATGLWVAVALGRSLSVPDRWLIWLAAIPPIAGEFGHFLNRFSLRHRGKSDTGIYVVLGRLHGAAWEPFRQGIFRLAIEAFKENDAEDIPVFAYKKNLVHRSCVLGTPYRRNHFDVVACESSSSVQFPVTGRAYLVSTLLPIAIWVKAVQLAPRVRGLRRGLA